MPKMGKPISKLQKVLTESPGCAGHRWELKTGNWRESLRQNLPRNETPVVYSHFMAGVILLVKLKKLWVRIHRVQGPID